MIVRESRDVLITDDDAGIRECVGAALQRHDLSFDTANNGAQALQCMQAKDYAVVLLDLLMPELDGFGVVAAMSAWTIRPRTRPIVLIMTAFDLRSDLPGIGENVHALVRKPFDLPELAELVSGCVRIRQKLEPTRVSASGRRAAGDDA